jgi:trehalose-6-phosphatase
MMDAIRRLSEDPQNAVCIVTGLTKLKLGDVFTDMKNVTLVTSNGLVYSWGANLLTGEIAALRYICG